MRSSSTRVGEHDRPRRHQIAPSSHLGPPKRASPRVVIVHQAKISPNISAPIGTARRRTADRRLERRSGAPRPHQHQMPTSRSPNTTGFGQTTTDPTSRSLRRKASLRAPLRAQRVRMRARRDGGPPCGPSRGGYERGRYGASWNVPCILVEWSNNQSKGGLGNKASWVSCCI